MSQRTKTVLSLTPQAVDILEASATERKRGEFVSGLLCDYDRLMSGVGALGEDDTGILERIDNRLARIEKQMDLMLSDRDK